jgi:hypothetical protein
MLFLILINKFLNVEGNLQTVHSKGRNYLGTGFITHQ